MVKKGYKKDDRSLRNELCVLLNFIVSAPASHEQFMAGEDSSVFEQMCTYAVYDENHEKPLLTTSEEDLELKQLLWTQIFEVLRGVGTPESFDTAFNGNFFKTLLMFLDPNTTINSTCINRWSESQLIELQVHCLSILGHLVPFCPERMYQVSCHLILANFLAYYTDKARRKACMLALQFMAPYDFMKAELPMVIDTLLPIV